MNMDSQEKWIPLNDSHIKEHITGKAPVALFTKNLKDQISFGVIDFDYPWDYPDVVEIQRIFMTKYDVPCYLAASSRKGWHLIFFWSEWTDMRLFISFWDHVYTESGFASWVNEGRQGFDGKNYKPPETFPSRLSYGDNVVTSLSCKAIKPPMVESRMKFKYNCFYKELEPSPVVIVDQWEYLANTVQMSPEYFAGVIAKHEIQLIDPSSRRTGRRVLLDAKGLELSSTEIVPKGKIDKVLKGCAAMGDIIDSEKMTHNKRLVLGIIAQHTEGGEERLLELIKGKKNWSQDETKKNLLYLKEKRYCPMTCDSMQKAGVCVKGIHPTEGPAKDHCLQPREVNGELIPPSPYRFALKNSKKDEATFSRLSRPIQDALELISSCGSRSLKPGDAEYDLASHNLRSSCVDAWARLEDMRAAEKGKMLSFLQAVPGFTKSDTKNLEREAKEKRKEAQTKDLQSDRTVLHFFRASWKISNGKYVRVKIDAKGNEVCEDISEFIVHIDNDVTEVRNLETIKSLKDLNENGSNRYISGSIVTTDNKIYSFKKFPASEMFDAKLSGFKKHISLTAGTDIGIYPNEEPFVLRCIEKFNSIPSKQKEDVTKKKILVKEVGWNGGCYLVSNMIISPRGIHNTSISYELAQENYMIEVDPRDWSKRMPAAAYGKSGVPEFHPAVMAEDKNEMKDLLLHFLNDFLSWHKAPITYIGTGFTLAAALQDLLDPTLHHFSPTLFYAGLTGKGKTEVVKAFQKFYGPWNNVVKFEGSLKFKTDLPSYFNDMMVVLDDYKRNFMKSKDLGQLIHNVYDRGTRNRLEKTGDAKDVEPSKGFLMIGGEDVFENEASAAARCLIVDFPAHSLSDDNADNFAKVLKNKDKYSAITAAVIARYIQKTGSNDAGLSGQLQVWFDEGCNKFAASEEYSKDNADRVVKNISLVYMAFRAFTQMCYEQYGVIGVDRLDDLNRQMVSACSIVCENTFRKIKEDKAGVNFLKEVTDLLQTQGEKYYIAGTGGVHPTAVTSVCIGWRDKVDYNCINLYVNTIIAALKDKYKSDKLFQSAKTIGNTLLEDGHVAIFQDSEKPFRRITNPDSKLRVDVLTIKFSSLFDVDESQLPNKDFDPPDFHSYSNVTKMPYKNWAPGSERSQ
jgi:hypothetical protein